MSADNFYIVRKHPLGGFAAVMGFASDTDENDEQIMPEAEINDKQFDKWQDAWNYALGEYSEYGYDVHPECMEEK